MLDLINRLAGFIGDLFQTHPYQHGAADMIADDTRTTALTTIHAGQLFIFTVKLLDLGAPASRVLCGRCPILRNIIRHDVVRAPGRERQSEQFHLMSGGKVAQMHQPSGTQFVLRPQQTIHAMIVFIFAVQADQAVILDRAVIDLPQPLNEQHFIFRRIPAVHQHYAKRQPFVIDGVGQHLTHMVKLALVVGFRSKDTVVNDPEPVGLRVNIHAGRHPNASDNLLGVAAPLLPHQFDLSRVNFVQHHIIEYDEPVRACDDLTPHVFPHQAGREMLTLTGYIAVDRIMAVMLGVFSKVRDRIIDLAAQQKFSSNTGA